MPSCKASVQPSALAQHTNSDAKLIAAVLAAQNGVRWLQQWQAHDGQMLCAMLLLLLGCLAPAKQDVLQPG
jgi:hypothetical protein